MEKILNKTESLSNVSTEYDSQSIIPKTKNNKKLFGDNEVIKRIFYKSNSEKELKLISIIVTFTSDESFDNSLLTKKPICNDSCRVDVYAVDIEKIETFINLFLDNGLPSNVNICQTSLDFIILLKDSLAKVSENCILFNFECSPLFKNKTTGEYELISKKSTFKLLKYLINDLKCHIMFSDFSLKALINDWDTEILGPNPLKVIGKVGGEENGKKGKIPKEKYKKEIELMSENIQKSESVQIKVVQLLSIDNILSMNCMRNSIIVEFDESILLTKTEKKEKNESNEKIYIKTEYKTEKYKFAILSEVRSIEEAIYDNNPFIEKIDSLKNPNKNKLISSANKENSQPSKVSIGHAYFKYATGSVLFVSTCHWHELDLSNFKVDDAKLKQFIQDNFTTDSLEIKVLENLEKCDISEYNIKLQILASNTIVSSLNAVNMTAFS